MKHNKAIKIGIILLILSALLFMYYVAPIHAKEPGEETVTLVGEQVKEPVNTKETQKEEPEKKEDGQADEPIKINVETTVTAPPIEKFLVTTAVVNEKEINESPVNTLPEVLRDQNGVTALSIANRKGKADIGIRGFGMNYIRVFIDGVPLNTANDRTVDFSLIPLEIIKQLEVIKGPAPVTYGSDAMGGIINIITKSGRENKHFFIRAAGGSYGSRDISVSAGTGTDKFGFFALAKVRGNNGYTIHSKENFIDLFMKADRDLGGGSNAMLMFFRTTGDRQTINGTNPDGSMRKQKSGFWSGSYNWEYNDILQQGINLIIRREADDKAGFRLNLYTKKYDDTLRGYVDPGTPIKPPAGSLFQYYRAGAWNYSYWISNIYGGDIRGIFPIGIHKITIGAGIEKSSFQDTYSGRSKPSDPPGSLSMPKNLWTKDFMNPEVGLNYNSVFAQDEIKLTPQLTFTLGLRNDSFDRSKPTLNGIANLVYENNNDTWRLTAGKTGRFPTLKELEGKGGNPNLKAEAAWNYEIDYRHRIPKSFDVEGALYYSAIHNLIQPVDPNDGFSIKENISLVKIFGGEAGISKTFGSLNTRLGYTYIHRTSPPLTPDWEEVPMHKATADLKWDKDGSICWAVQGIIQSNKKTGDPAIKEIPGYGIVNVMMAYPTLAVTDDSKYNWNVVFKATNLFNVKYQDRLYYYAPGRWITGTVNIRF